MAGEEVQPQTTLIAVVGARTLLRRAVSSGYTSAAPKSPRVYVPHVPCEPLFQDDLDAVIAVAEPSLNVMLRLLSETGLRIFDAMTLRQCDVARSGDVWFVRIDKHGVFVPKTTHSARGGPISDELAQDLRALANAPQDALSPCNTRNPYPHWRMLLKKAEEKAGVKPFTFHGIRRAVSDRLRRNGTPLDVYVALMGHAAVTGLKHYSTVSLDDLREAQVKALTGVRRRKKEDPLGAQDGAAD